MLSATDFAEKPRETIAPKAEAILGNAVTSQHGALLSDDIKALKTNR